jgi:hypothetical protein
VVDLDTGRTRPLFRGAVGGAAWSPDGRWVLLAWPSADQWLFVGARAGRPIRAVSAIRSQFDPRGARRFPTIDGWCC